MLSCPEFQPHPLLRSGHAQTVFAALGKPASVPYRAMRHTIDTTDGDQLVLHDDCPSSWKSGQPCVVLVHGLGGSHASPYMVRIACKLTERGVRAFRLDLRGCGAGYDLATKPGHAGRSEDVRAALEFVLQRCPDSPVSPVGFSLGANIVLKLMGEWSGDAPTAIVNAMAVAPPVDLLACAINMQRPAMKLYNRFFVKALNRHIEQRRSFVPELESIDLSIRPKTLFEFDDRVTAPLSGFAGARDYYAQSSSSRCLGGIRVPTMILSAADDPIVPAHSLAELQPSAYLRPTITRHGGHVGFVGRSGVDPDRYWMDWRVIEFVLAH